MAAAAAAAVLPQLRLRRAAEPVDPPWAVRDTTKPLCAKPFYLSSSPVAKYVPPFLLQLYSFPIIFSANPFCSVTSDMFMGVLVLVRSKLTPKLKLFIQTHVLVWC
jgi:hypothetical protein